MDQEKELVRESTTLKTLVYFFPELLSIDKLYAAQIMITFNSYCGPLQRSRAIRCLQYLFVLEGEVDYLL